MIIVDRIVAGVLAAYVLIGFGATLFVDHYAGLLVVLPIALLPVGLLLIPRVSSMLAVAVSSLPCFVGAGMFLDAGSSAEITDKLFSYGSPFLLIVGFYALLRAVHIAHINAKERLAKVPRD